MKRSSITLLLGGSLAILAICGGVGYGLLYNKHLTARKEYVAIKPWGVKVATGGLHVVPMQNSYGNVSPTEPLVFELSLPDYDKYFDKCSTDKTDSQKAEVGELERSFDPWTEPFSVRRKYTPDKIVGINGRWYVFTAITNADCFSDPKIRAKLLDLARSYAPTFDVRPL
jgi:hypothetical protein